MHAIVMGCGRVGVSVASKLAAEGNSVAIIDRDTTSFRSLPADFSGRTVKGVGFDLDTLKEAGIETADAFIAVSSGDNSNIISARVAREKFKIKIVIARIYDPRRAEVYARLGIPTIASVAWSTQQILGLMHPQTPVALWHDANDSINVTAIQPDPSWIGKSLGQIESMIGARTVCVQRNGQNILASSELLIQDGDQLAIAHSSLDQTSVDALRTQSRTSK